MISKQLALYLQTQALGTIGTDLFYGFLPSAPDTLTTVFDTGGAEGDRKLGYDYPTIQVRTRAAVGSGSIEGAYGRLTSIYNVMQSLHDVTLNDGTILIDVWAMQSAPISLGKDEQGRAEFTQNYRLYIRNATNHRE